MRLRRLSHDLLYCLLGVIVVSMTVQRRLGIAGLLLAFALGAFGAAKYYSLALIVYVVEQALIQKAPSGTSAIMLHERLQGFLAASPNRTRMMEKLLRISGRLEKTQSLTRAELDEVLREDSEDSRR